MKKIPNFVLIAWAVVALFIVIILTPIISILIACIVVGLAMYALYLLIRMDKEDP